MCIQGCCSATSSGPGCTDPNDPCYGQGTCCGPNSCDECACNEGSSCGTCGTVGCDGTCDDPCAGGGGGGDPCGGCPSGEVCTQNWTFFGYEYWCEQSTDPVIVSLDGSAFPLTSAADGVRFDFFGTRSPVQLSWTTRGARIGWLAFDLNRNGQIDSGQELFSNVTPQPAPATARLGFKALAMYDTVGFHGNGDGQIDAHDYIFSRLRVWVDQNHNGISEPGELLTMQQAGITAISTHYFPDNWTDQYGNRFRYRAQITWADPKRGKGQGDGGGRAQWAYDVILVQSSK